jgi:hypothetical protein
VKATFYLRIADHAPFEVKQVEQLALIDLLPTHHNLSPSLKTSSRRNQDSPMIARDFFYSIRPERTCRNRDPITQRLA